MPAWCRAARRRCNRTPVIASRRATPFRGRFRIEVVAAPTIFVRTVEYKYPKYTGLLAQRVEQQGDLKGIEGTEVTIEAVTNTDIESAQVDFDCDGKFDQRMQTDGQNAKASFRLALTDDRKTPWHESYQLIFKDAQGQQNPQPVRHQIEVTRDVPPEIEFVAPEQGRDRLAGQRGRELGSRGQRSRLCFEAGQAVGRARQGGIVRQAIVGRRAPRAVRGQVSLRAAASWG